MSLSSCVWTKMLGRLQNMGHRVFNYKVELYWLFNTNTLETGSIRAVVM